MTPLYSMLIRVSEKTGIPVKKILDMFFLLKKGEPLENNYLLQKVGLSKNAANQVKESLSNLFQPSSLKTQLRKDVLDQVQSLFEDEFKLEESFWTVLENDNFERIVKLLNKYSNLRPSAKREYDQFTATLETTARRATLIEFFGDIKDKRLLFLGDDDFTSVAIASFKTARDIVAADIDDRILDNIKIVSQKEGFEVRTMSYDARKALPKDLRGKFDAVFTDPPYTQMAVELFISRAVAALDATNQSARIYACYGNSDRAKERFLPVYDVFVKSGLMTRWVFDKFNRYAGAESIGNSSTLFICDVTPKTKPIISNKDYSEPIYTFN